MQHQKASGLELRACVLYTMQLGSNRVKQHSNMHGSLHAFPVHVRPCACTAIPIWCTALQSRAYDHMIMQRSECSTCWCRCTVVTVKQMHLSRKICTESWSDCFLVLDLFALVLTKASGKA